MTNRDRLIEALRGTATDAVYRYVLLEKINCQYMYQNKGFCMDERVYERTAEDMCIACIEDWLSQEIDYEMERVGNANV